MSICFRDALESDCSAIARSRNNQTKNLPPFHLLIMHRTSHVTLHRIYNESVIAGGATADMHPQSADARVQVSCTLIPTSPHDRSLNLFVRLLTCVTCQWFRNRDISKRPVIVATAAADEVIAWAAFTNFKVNGACTCRRYYLSVFV